MQKEGLKRREQLYRKDESGYRRGSRAAEEEGAERLERKCVTRTSYINVTQEQASGGREQREGAEGSRAEERKRREAERREAERKRREGAEGSGAEAEGGASMGYRECREAWLSHFLP